jgi:uncharacterized membrane protein SpoIIM required for sporulation
MKDFLDNLATYLIFLGVLIMLLVIFNYFSFQKNIIGYMSPDFANELGLTNIDLNNSFHATRVYFTRLSGGEAQYKAAQPFIGVPPVTFGVDSGTTGKDLIPLCKDAGTSKCVLLSDLPH